MTAITDTNGTRRRAAHPETVRHARHPGGTPRPGPRRRPRPPGIPPSPVRRRDQPPLRHRHQPPAAPGPLRASSPPSRAPAFTASPGIPAAQIRDLAALRWLAARESVILSGPVGAGKTFIACALGHQVIRAGHEVRFAKTSRVLADLAGGRADATWDKRLVQVRDAAPSLASPASLPAAPSPGSPASRPPASSGGSISAG